MIALNDNSKDPEPTGGMGGFCRRDSTESGLHPTHEGRMIERAVREGWIVADRWPTRESKEDIEKAVAERGNGKSLIEKTVLAVHDLLDSSDDRAKGIGARVAATLESQNQADQKTDEPATQVNVQVNVSDMRQQILANPDFIEFQRQKALNGNGNGTANG